MSECRFFNQFKDENGSFSSRLIKLVCTKCLFAHTTGEGESSAGKILECDMHGYTRRQGALKSCGFTLDASCAAFQVLVTALTQSTGTQRKTHPVQTAGWWTLKP